LSLLTSKSSSWNCQPFRILTNLCYVPPGEETHETNKTECKWVLKNLQSIHPSKPRFVDHDEDPTPTKPQETPNNARSPLNTHATKEIKAIVFWRFIQKATNSPQNGRPNV
jgi:hypothetical protein